MARPKVWLIIDCHFMFWRSFHTFGGLSHAGEGTGVTYGFLRDLQVLMHEHDTEDVVFCFEGGGKSKRKEMHPAYKAARHSKPLTEEQKAAFGDMKKQIKKVRVDILPALGYRNVHSHPGYEADDVIASVVKRSMGGRDQAVIVSADHDLYQLLSPRVGMWNPTKKVYYTDKAFEKEFGIKPEMWYKVKAIAGCSTDDVPGIKGVGEKTAARFVYEQPILPSLRKVSLKNYSAIVEWINNGRYRDNIKLVRLPFDGCPTFNLHHDRVDKKAWDRITKEMGMASLKGRAPGSAGGFGYGVPSRR